MSTSTKRPLAQAMKDAEEFRALFAGCYERWEIAGRVRRGKAEVGDVEHVVIPRPCCAGAERPAQLLWHRLESLTNESNGLFRDYTLPFTKHAYVNSTTGKQSASLG